MLAAESMCRIDRAVQLRATSLNFHLLPSKEFAVTHAHIGDSELRVKFFPSSFFLVAKIFLLAFSFFQFNLLGKCTCFSPLIDMYLNVMMVALVKMF